MNPRSRKPIHMVMAVFISLWLVYYMVEMVSGRITGVYQGVINLIIPLAYLSLMAVFFYLLSERYGSGIKTKNIIMAAMCLIILDQAVKWLVRTFPDGGEPVEIIYNWIYFYPVLNTKGSWGASRFGLMFGIKLFIIVNIVAIPIIIQGCRFYTSRKGKSFWVDTFLILSMAGSICSLIDKVFFGGSLDFMMLNGLFVADIKDFYLTFASACLITGVLVNPETLKNGGVREDMDLLKDFFRFNSNDLRRLWKRLTVKSGGII